MESSISQIKKDYLDKISRAKTLKELDDIFLALFGKNGEITLLPKEFSKLTPSEKQKIGPLFNAVKTELESAIEKRREEIREVGYAELTGEGLDLQPVEVKPRKGHLHPITQFEKEIIDLFDKLGFQQFDAPHVDTDEYNFELLNIPAEHPARDLWDTLYIDSKNSGIQPGKLLLRTHTSNAQIRAMRDIKTPLRMMSLGRCFRYEAVDARHNHTFEQFEIVYVDKRVSMTNLQYLSETFLKAIFGPEIKTRLRPKYFPFVEPGAGVEGECVFCKGKGCRICGGVGWLELAGAGMIHPTVLQNGGINPSEYSGIAWGFGPERLIMLKYGIADLREFLSGDLKFLEKF
ncbi:phenylalanine--tRNA ligase subunit alpha [Candidatus Daviesbacteria bacterium RIFCSPLOWO2_01_FULL_43_38]|uniref:Phenylalanine--tRNA ligase alpha subunit n=3 Tax=Candidatus Daviesiibacteriota TaxID=1752718 RepID=A0A1F5K423_9BACT|nr:MAG: Phenylalanine-tRNA ligase alpha subunit [Candidatus Daviesbacteria bacterium GW2011_GWA1_42_6]KKS71074.1 MAG: Phenylalanine-tRNA ligase alpha subunit [Candidatus Daviesbacteria bacterium GW2011_GWA2_42_7]OGE19972.1 MAG: phenylalanine--tRNA ligase subunit alpha [Candidatus Daviesbacteria bacterium RIFCSPHIGHO2_01_FULL_43_17]OGE35722.1 MAG: phenylalanine--tRNA ligase subunit alpha [Candidatus Daviesbacteria bacterium RIFCSPHIGHO2_12_FULL_43_11]OGE63410.1 MAG: phenylalanine--tRNA ligase su